MKSKHRYSRMTEICIFCGLRRVDIVGRQLGCYKWVRKYTPVSLALVEEEISYHAQRLKAKFLSLVRNREQLDY